MVDNSEYTNADGIKYKVKSQSIKESFTNDFAQQVYKLEDGTIIYVNYGKDRIEILTPTSK